MLLPVRLPRVHHFRVSDAILESLIIKKIKHVLDRKRQDRTAVAGAEDRLKKIIDKDLQSALQSNDELNTTIPEKKKWSGRLPTREKTEMTVIKFFARIKPWSKAAG